MGLLKDAIKQAYAEQGTEITWMGNKAKRIQSTAQAEYSDLRKTEYNYTRGVHNANMANSGEYSIGDIVPYRNTRGNVKLAEITSFEDVGNGKKWFHGIDTVTKAKVWYPVHISKNLKGGFV